ncbi:BCCT (betaine/carnitine/choline) family transporter [Campylobacter sp. RM5004]|uniref:BCCT family transporter n=1 Tax=Campylobacter sp. RM5004 TaxID=1660078 RepID=UPI001EFC19F2|nr:BCCT family transporter [Campylobacter sp. RM5004]ULO00811.1 BCCT (betaine/carnitine/choline) family transporter [Campylobacter sp. RM5004]
MEKNKLFLICAPIVIIIAIFAIIFPKELTNFIISSTQFFYVVFDWFIIWLPLLGLGLGFYFAFSKYGKIKLGDAEPEYSTYSWMSMLFTAGIGVGIVFYGPLEALWHYQSAPIGINGNFDQQQAMENAMSISLFVWGLPAWALYTFGGVVVAYFAYRHGGSFSPDSCVRIGFKDKKFAKPLAIFILVFAIVGIALSVTASIAMATGQISSGLKIITDGGDFTSMTWKMAIMIALFAAFTLAAILPIAKGMKFLGDWTMIFAIALLLFVFFTGPTHYFVSVITTLIGKIITDTIPHSFELYIFKSRDWLVWYPLSYIVWWIGWTPFVGVFLAKISRGRTLKEFILCSTLIPTGFMVVWFSVFSGYGLLDEVQMSKEIVAMANSNGYEGTIYRILQDFPFTKLTQIITVFLFVSFVITTITSAAISLGIMTNDGKNESKVKAAFWCIIMAIVASAVVITGKIEGIKAMGSFTGFPFVYLLFIMGAAFIKQIRKDNK